MVRVSRTHIDCWKKQHRIDLLGLMGIGIWRLRILQIVSNVEYRSDDVISMNQRDAKAVYHYCGLPELYPTILFETKFNRSPDRINKFKQFLFKMKATSALFSLGSCLKMVTSTLDEDCHHWHGGNPASKVRNVRKKLIF